MSIETAEETARQPTYMSQTAAPAHGLNTAPYSI